MNQQIDAEREQATKIIAANLRTIAGRQVAFKLVEHTRAVFGEAYGAATEAVVSRASLT